jgi:hypothetical protein
METRRTRRMPWIAVLTAAGAAVVPALPFARSGSRVRSGYELVRTAESAGVLQGTIGRVALVALALLPLLAAAAFAAASLRWTNAVATLAVMAGFVVAGSGIAMLRSPVTALIGGPLSIVVGILGIGAGVAVLRIR